MKYKLTYIDRTTNTEIIEKFEADSSKSAIKKAEKILANKKYTEPELVEDLNYNTNVIKKYEGCKYCCCADCVNSCQQCNTCTGNDTAIGGCGEYNNVLKETLQEQISLF
ncbi:hypothetical protein [Clostridium thermarum]|uniref:hypothetical protein n=1 Tax=Clostridium thermarum TaxID=1716543 RepID=UPI00111F3978|nr:hypothetical protein [Clostridium thermarum]